MPCVHCFYQTFWDTLYLFPVSLPKKCEKFGQPVKGREKRFPHTCVLGTKCFLRVSIFIKLKESV